MPEAEFTPPDALPHLHSLLIDALRHRRGNGAHQGPVTVAEIYQELVPYRHVRTALGLELNADYEHTLLRLLAGEADLARLEPDEAREQLARELESPNPNVTLYRKYAACDVWLLEPPPTAPAPSWLEEHLADEGREGVADEAEAVESDAAGGDAWESPAFAGRTFTVAEDVAEEDGEIEETLARVLGEDEPGAATPAAGPPEAADSAPPEPRPGYCMFCDSALPRGRAARYCPYCGADQQQRPCRACGEAVEPEWAFCIACGEAAPAADA